MGAVHYSASELAELLDRTAHAYRIRGHIEACEECHFLLALVRKTQGEPSDEDAEVTLDALRGWCQPARDG